jgi:hypothetical protein
MNMKIILIVPFSVAVITALVLDALYNPANSTLPWRDSHAVYIVERAQTPAVKNDQGIVSVANYTLTYKTRG